MRRRGAFATPNELRRRRIRRLLAQRAVSQALISVAGLTGQPVNGSDDARIGRVLDVIARWDGSPYPVVTGLLARVGLRRVFVPIEQVTEIHHEGVRLSSARLDLRDYMRREGEVLLVRDVVDHQLVDVEGVRVVRASDLYLARVAETYRLVGADVGLESLLRRLGPKHWRTRPTPDRVIDWEAIQPFGAPGAPLRLRAPSQALRLLRPAELADVLEELGHGQRQELLEALGSEVAADALEEMEPDDLGALLRESSVDQVVALLGEMEPDEAVDALRGLDEDRRHELMDAMPRDKERELTGLLAYPADTAGGFMTSHLVQVRLTDTVGELRQRLHEELGHRTDVAGVLVIDDDGRLVDDVTVFELLVAGDDTRIESLVGPPWPVTVVADASIDEVVEAFLANRESSIVVVDDDGRPLGRILADDVVEALVRRRGRLLIGS